MHGEEAVLLIAGVQEGCECMGRRQIKLGHF